MRTVLNKVATKLLTACFFWLTLRLPESLGASLDTSACRVAVMRLPHCTGTSFEFNCTRGSKTPLLYDTDIQKTSLAGYCIDQIGVGMKLSDQPAGHGVFGQSHGQVVAVGHHGKTALVI